MMHIQRPLPISSRGDFSVIHELRCIQLNKEHVPCTNEINLYQGINCQVWRGKAGWGPVSFPVSTTYTCRTVCGTVCSMAIMHSLTYCCPCLAPAMVTLLAAAVQVNQSVLALQATVGRHCCQFPQIKGLLVADESGQCFGGHFGPVLRNLYCSGLEGVSSDQAVSSCPCVLFPKPVALLLARSKQTQQRQKFHHEQLQIRGKSLLMLLLRQNLQNELIICNSRKSSQENGSGNVPICLFIKNFLCLSQTPEDTRHQTVLAPMLIRLFPFHLHLESLNCH